MTVSEFRNHLARSAGHELSFVLPDGGRIPLHAHVTEVGRTDRRFLDCGGTIRSVSTCTLQAWVANDTDHRLLPGSLVAIIEKAAAILETDGLDVEIEYEDGFLSQFPVLEAATTETTLHFHLGSKHTDCLAKEVCIPRANSCSTEGRCC